MRKERVQLQHVDQFDIDEVHLMWNTKPNQLRIEPSRKRKLKPSEKPNIMLQRIKPSATKPPIDKIPP